MEHAMAASRVSSTEASTTFTSSPSSSMGRGYFARALSIQVMGPLFQVAAIAGATQDDAVPSSKVSFTGLWSE